MRLEVFREWLLDCKLVVVYDCPLEEFCEVFCVDNEGDAQWLCDFQKWVGYMRLTDLKVSLFVHELVHYAHWQLGELRMPLTDDTEELYSNFVEYFLTAGIKSLELKMQ